MAMSDSYRKAHQVDEQSTSDPNGTYLSYK